MFLMMVADRHKRKNRSIRLPEDLEQQVDAEVAKRGLKFNAAAVEAFRAWVSGHTMKSARRAAVRPQRPSSSGSAPLGYSKEQQARKGKR